MKYISWSHFAFCTQPTIEISVLSYMLTLFP